MALSYWARIDSNSANNPALNLTGDDAIEFTFINETPSGGSGNYELEQQPGGATDPNTIVDIGGTTYSFSFELTGFLPTQNKDGAQQVPAQYEGAKTALITVEDYPDPGDSTRLAFLIDDQATQTEMDDFGTGRISLQNLDETPPDTAICLARGTSILTPSGERLIEDLAVGDLVVTAAGGAMPIRYITYQRFDRIEEESEAQNLPMRIFKDAFGLGLPNRDLIVSPNHRITLRHWAVELLFATEKVFCAAKFLEGHVAGHITPAGGAIEYYNLLLDEHTEIVANGLPVESLFLGESTLENLGQRVSEKMLVHVDYAPSDGNCVRKTALPTLTRDETNVFLAYSKLAGLDRTGAGAVGLAA